jgi:hypothetical protein
VKNIEDYGFDRSDLIIATAVNSYLKNLTIERRANFRKDTRRQQDLPGLILLDIHSRHSCRFTNLQV